MRPLARLKVHDRPLPETGRRATDANELGDLRFRALLSEIDWLSLPPPIRHRFSKRLAGGNTAVYVGEVTETQIAKFIRLKRRSRCFKC